MMNAAFKTLGPFCVAVMAVTAWAAEDTGSAEGKPPHEPDWAAQIEKINLKPAKVKLVRESDINSDLATLRVRGRAAATDYVPTNPVLVPLAKLGGPGCKLVDGGLVVGQGCFTDRRYKLVEVPKKMLGLTHMQTKCGHKAIVDAR